MLSSQKLQIWLKPNCTWMFIRWSSTNFTFFVPIKKFKMAATAGLSLTLDPMGKMFQNASSLKPLGQLKPNCSGMIIGRSSTNFRFVMPIGNPRWPPPQYIDYHWTLWENVQKPSQKLQILLKPNCTWMFIRWSSTNFTFFVPVWNSKWRLRQDLV